jgi:plasmid stabilization system protein ParE
VRRVVWSEDALDKFEDLVGYIAADSPSAALAVADRIDDAVKALAAMPVGRSGRVAGTYEKVVSGLPYVIAYALGDEPRGHETLTALRIVHGARDGPEGQWPGE